MNDEQLRRLLNDAVSDIEPEDRLDELRAEVGTRTRVLRHFHARPWYAAAGIVAAVICLVAYVASVAGDKSTEPGFSHPGGTSVPTIIATDPADPSASSSGTTSDRFAVYYLGDGPNGPVLYQETVPAGDDPMHAAISALNGGARDPDYRTGWGPGTIVSAYLAGDTVTVELGAMRADRPRGMSVRKAEEIVQQAVYTFRAASGRPGTVVQFLRHGKPAPSVLGVPTARPVAPGRVLDVLSLMSIRSPEEGESLTRGTLEVTGSNNGPEGNVVVKLLRSTANGEVVVRTASGTALGSRGNRLYDWRVSVDTADLSPGSYTLRASNADLSGGTEGNGPAFDTRTIVLR